MSGHPDELLSAFLDGELSAADRAQVQDHLRECAACARELEELAAVDALVRELPVAAPPGYFEELPGRVRARVRRPARVPRLAVWAAAAAAAVMAVVVTPIMLQRERAVVAPSARAVPEVPAPAAPPPATVPPSPAGRADTGAIRGNSVPVPQAKRETRGRLQERDQADKAVAFDEPAATAPPAAPLARAENRTAPAATAQAAPAESVDVLAATSQEGARAEPAAEAQKERAAAPPPERKLAAGSGAFAHPDDRALMTDKRYQALLSRPATSAAQARALRDAWELFARDLPAAPRADEARVRAIEAGALAWRLGHDPGDLATTRARARAYLDAETAPQAARVRALLEHLPPGP